MRIKHPQKHHRSHSSSSLPSHPSSSPQTSSELLLTYNSLFATLNTSSISKTSTTKHLLTQLNTIVYELFSLITKTENSIQQKYEQQLRLVEMKNRSLVKKIMEYDIDIVNYQHEISQLLQIKKLNNTQKESEIYILRTENSNIKRAITQLERKLKEYELKYNQCVNEKENLQKQMKMKYNNKQLELKLSTECFDNVSINGFRSVNNNNNNKRNLISMNISKYANNKVHSVHGKRCTRNCNDNNKIKESKTQTLFTSFVNNNNNNNNSHSNNSSSCKYSEMYKHKKIKTNCITTTTTCRTQLHGSYTSRNISSHLNNNNSHNNMLEHKSCLIIRKKRKECCFMGNNKSHFENKETSNNI